MNEKNKELLDSKLGSKSPTSKPSSTKPNPTGGRKQSRRKKELLSKDEAKRDQQHCRREPLENDPKWYAANPQLLQDAFSMSTPYSLGSVMRLSDVSTNVPPSTSSWSQYVTPGILKIGLLPIPGVSKDAASPLNVAAGKLYQWMRHANAGQSMYDASDVMMYMLAMDNAYMMWNWLARAYGVMRTYNQSNLYMPRALFEAMGLDFDSFLPRMNEFRTILNIFGSNIGSYSVPAVMPYFTRHSWLFSNIYTDEPDYKAQLYLYTPSHLFRWVEKTPDGALGYLEPMEIGPKLTYDAVFAMMRDIQLGLDRSGDIGIISGDILKAFGYNNLLTVPEVLEDYMVVPVYSDEVLTQIENSEFMGTFLTTEAAGYGRIRQNDASEIICNPKFSADVRALFPEDILNFHKDSVTADDVAVATRLKVSFDPTSFDNGVVELYAAGSEVVTKMEVIALSTEDPRQTTSVLVTSNINVSASSAVNELTALSPFTRHPVCRTLYKSGEWWKTRGFVGDLDNMTLIDAQQLYQMHQVALLSLFDVPRVAFG